MTSPLEQANIDWHTQLEKGYTQFLIALTELNLDKAKQTWEAYKSSMQQHISFEDEHVIPLGEGLENNQPILIAADHKILQRLVTRIDPALEELRQSLTPRETLVDQLDGYLKMRNVLKHHDLREVQECYPALVSTQSKTNLNSLANKMNSLLAEETN